MKLLYTRKAVAELDEILSSLAEASPQGLASVGKRIHNVIRLLTTYPRIGTMTSKDGLRRVVVVPYPYVIFYKITDKAIVIHGVRHGARASLT